VVELDRRVHHAKLQEAIAAGCGAYRDVVVVVLAVNVRRAEESPAAGGVRAGGQNAQQGYNKNGNEHSFHAKISSSIRSEPPHHEPAGVQGQVSCAIHSLLKTRALSGSFAENTERRFFIDFQAHPRWPAGSYNLAAQTAQEFMC